MDRFRQLRICFPVFLLVISSLSCGDLGTDYTYDDVYGIQVRADVRSLFLTNKTVETIYYFAIEQVTFRPPIDWIPPCFVSVSVQSGETKEIPYWQITGYKQGCQVVVLWWHCSGTMVSVRALVCKTP